MVPDKIILFIECSLNIDMYIDKMLEIVLELVM
jgi:hypothetical protein